MVNPFINSPLASVILIGCKFFMIQTNYTTVNLTLTKVYHSLIATK